MELDLGLIGVHHHLLEEDEHSSKNNKLKGYNGHFVIGLTNFWLTISQRGQLRNNLHTWMTIYVINKL